MTSICCSVLLVGRPVASLSTQKTILEKAGYTVTVITGEQEAAYQLAKHKTAAAVLCLPSHLLQSHIFSAVILCHTVPMEERHHIGSVVREISDLRPKLLVLHRSGNCTGSHADAAIDSREGQGRILAVLNELIEGKYSGRAATPLNVEFVGADSPRPQDDVSGKTTEKPGRPLFGRGKFAT